MYQKLMQEPFKLTLDDLAGMTDDQIVGLFTERNGIRANPKARQKALENLERYKKLTFKQSFIEDFTRGDPARREEAERHFKHSFPNYEGD